MSDLSKFGIMVVMQQKLDDGGLKSLEGGGGGDGTKNR